MKILAFGDLIGKTSIVERVLNLDLSNYNLLLYTGDTPNPAVFKHLRESRISQGIDENTDIEKELVKDTMPYKALKKATKEVVDICKLLKKVEIPFYGVLGNADLQYYTRHIKWPFVSLHNKTTNIKNLDFVGYNGRPLYKFESENKNENAFSENEIEVDLEKHLSNLDSRKTVLVTHAPPFEILDQVENKMTEYAVNTYGKRAGKGNIGSVGLRKVVDEHKPLLHIFSHIHEDRGVVEGVTTFVNIGSTGEDNIVCSIEIVNSDINIDFLPLTT